MAILLKTDYSSCDGPLDEPVWKAAGLHASKTAGRVLIVDDPLDLYGNVIRFRVDGDGKDNVFNTPNADRAEVMNGKNFAGQRIFISCRILLQDYQSNGGQWNVMPFDIHDANPGPTQSPIMYFCENDNKLGVRLWGGPVSSNGNTGTIRNDTLRGVTVPTDKWFTFISEVLFDSDKDTGVFRVWINGTKIWDTKAATIVEGHGCYLKHGFYRATTSLTSMYYATDMGIFTTLTEAQDHVLEEGGGGGGDPPPDPDPPEFDVEPANYLGGAYKISTRNQHGSQTNKQRCYKAVVQSTGTVTALGTYREPQNVTGTETVKLAVWPDNGTGTDPGAGAPLGMTGELAFTSASAAGRYSANVTSSFGVSTGQVVWIGELSGGTANISFTRAANSGLFRLMDAAYTGGVVAWNTTADSEYPLDLTTWMTGTLGPGQPPPTTVTAPVISGSSLLGSTITLTSVGVWAGPAPTFTYAWFRSLSAANRNQITFVNQTGTSYTTQPADRGLYIYCRVMATNSLGTDFGYSNFIGPIFTVATHTPGGHRVGGRTVRAERRPGAGGGGG